MLLEIVLWAAAVSFVVIGIGGLFLPAVPGAPMVFAGLLAAAWAEDFAYVGWRTLTLLGLLAALTYVLEFAATALGAERFGASGRGVMGAIAGSLVGIFFAPIGLLLGPFIGALLGELTRRQDLSSAGRAGLGATIGFLLGTALKLAVAFTMVAVFAAVRLWGI